jgi:hypothetical protein
VDDIQDRYARELIDAVNAALAQDPGVQACLDRARADGFELKIAIDALIEPVDRGDPAFAITAADRRFLRSLRIAAEPPEEA